MSYILTAEARRLLKKPLVRPKKALPKRVNGRLITIGDACSYNFIKQGIIPDLIVYDCKEKRRRAAAEKLNAIGRVKCDEITVKNPRSTIQDEAWVAIELGMHRRTKIKVIGEEDLLAVPAILLAPEKASVCYGQPNNGIVIIESNKKTKTKVQKILAKMEVRQ